MLPDQLHSPGHSPGQQTIAGDYILDGLLRIEIAGTTPGLEYDQLLVGGDAILNGSIEVVLLNDFIPDPADVFDVIIADSFEIGDLFSIIFPQLPDGHYFTWSLFTLEDGQVAFRIVDPEIDAAPEPFTLALFGAGLAGLGILRRRRAI